MHRFHVVFFIIGLVVSACLADEDDETSAEDGKNQFLGFAGDPLKGFGDVFKNTAEEVKLRAESGVGTIKEFSDQAREKTEGVAKGFADGISEHFSKAKDKIEETGEKMKEAFSSAAEKSKDEFETAASKMSKYSKEASDTVFSLFKF